MLWSTYEGFLMNIGQVSLRTKGCEFLETRGQLDRETWLDLPLTYGADPTND